MIKKTLVYCCLLVVMGMCAFPPWQRVYRLSHSTVNRTEPIGYAFIANPPEFVPYTIERSIDYGRLGVQLLGPVLLAVILIIFSIIPAKEKFHG